VYVATMRGGLGRVGNGLGDAAGAAKTIQIVGGTTAGIATGILGTLTSGGATAILGITSAAVPVIGAALMGAVTLVQYLVANSGCGQTCIETSQWANQAAAALQQVLDGYFALPAPRTKAQQAVALAAFDGIWHQLQQACGQPGTGNAGVRCISDRQRGACTWKQAYAPVYPGEPNIGECWNWFNGYRDPIANDPTVPDPTPTVDSVVSSVSDDLSSFLPATAAGGSSVLPALLIGGLVLWGILS
jgi:hypothetical protein